MKNKTDPIIYSHTAIRGIAALAVFIGHLYWFYKTEWNLESGYFIPFLWHNEAVDLFFILSGFILNWVYCCGNRAINWKSYLKARVGRIMPLYYLTLAVFLAIPVWSFLRHGFKYIGADYFRDLIPNLLMISGILSGIYTTYNIPAWSIGIEFFCYLLIFPLLFIASAHLYKFNYRKILYISIITLSTIALIIVHNKALQNNIELNRTNQHFWNSAQLLRGIFGFTCGYFLCSLFENNKLIIPDIKIINIIMSIGICCMALSRISFIENNSLMILIFPVIVYFSAYDLGFFSYLFKIGLFQWLGERTYSLYMWHWPVMSFITNYLHKSLFFNTHINCSVKITFLIVIVLAVSQISYIYIETPARKVIRNLGQKI